MLSCKLWSYCPYNNLSKNICRSASVFISLFLNWTQNYRAHGLCFVCRRLVVASFATYNTHSCNCCCFSKRLAILRPTLTHKHTQTYSAHYTHTQTARGFVWTPFGFAWVLELPSLLSTSPSPSPSSSACLFSTFVQRITRGVSVLTLAEFTVCCRPLINC